MPSDEPLALEGPVLLRLPSGDLYRLTPSRGGLSIRHVTATRSEGPGRPPRAGTHALRARLTEDAKKGSLRSSREYVNWMVKQDPGIALPTARQIVYRERRRLVDENPELTVEESQGRRRDSTLELRKRIEKDAAGSGVKDAKQYVKWLVEHDRELGLKSARQTVYRELRRGR